MRFTEYNVRLSAYAAVIDSDGRILLSWYNGDGSGWVLPGGGVEYEERVEECIVREVREETGYEVQLGRLLLVDSYTKPVTLDDDREPPRPYKAVRIVYGAQICGGGLGTTETNGTTDRAAWFRLSEIRPAASHRDLIDLAVAAARRGTTV